MIDAVKLAKFFFFPKNFPTTLTDDGDKDGADLPSCELRTRIKLEISVRDDDPLPLDRNKWEFW